MNKTIPRLMAMAMLVIFVFSIVPIAFAEEETSEREQAEEMREQLREREARMEKKDAALERAEQMRSALREKKERYLEARQAYLDKKERLSELRRQAGECAEGSEECRVKKLDLKKGVRDHLLKTADLIDRSLEKLQERVTESKVLSEEEKQEALNRLTELEKQLDEKRAEIEALPDTVTNEELRTHLRELKDLWHKVRKEQRWVITQLINNKQDNLVGIYIRFGERAEAQIQKLEQQGADVTQLEELLIKYRESVEQLKLAQADARNAWLEAKSSPEALEKARELQQAFREKAKETKSSLRNLLQELKEVRKALAGEAPENASGEEELEEEENESANATSE